MLFRRCYIIGLTLLVLLTLLTCYQTIISNNGAFKSEILRQILQKRHDAGEDVLTTMKLTNFGEDILPAMKYNAPYVPPIRNDTGNVPDAYFTNIIKPTGHNKTCARYPDFFDLRFRNDYWQIQKTTNGTFHLFNAYLDQRLSNTSGPVVRILATYDVYRTSERFYCQLWYDNNTLKIVESEALLWMFHQKWGADTGYLHHPYLVTCPVVMEKGKWPMSVSLVEEPCQNANNNVQIRYKHFEEKKNFVVCVKGLSFPYEDNSARLVEWIELINILGAEKINFYEFSVHPNAKRVLDYYVARGMIEVTPVSLVDDFSNQPRLQSRFLSKRVTPRRLQEVIPFNDCLYKHLEEFRYVVLLDTDEVVVPLQDTWIELLNVLNTKVPGVTSFVARNVYFLDDFLHQHAWFEEIPRYMHMLQHVYRSKNYTQPGYFVKGFHNTQRVMALHNHFPFACLNGCSSKEIDLGLAHLQHYRADCASGAGDCKGMKANSIADFRIWNYKNELIERVERTMKQLDFLDT